VENVTHPFNGEAILFTVNGTAAKTTILVSLLLLDTILVCASTMVNALKAIVEMSHH